MRLRTVFRSGESDTSEGSIPPDEWDPSPVRGDGFKNLQMFITDCIANDTRKGLPTIIFYFCHMIWCRKVDKYISKVKDNTIVVKDETKQKFTRKIQIKIYHEQVKTHPLFPPSL